MDDVSKVGTAGLDEPRPGRIRCSDGDRREVEQVLHQALGEGRLTMHEVEARIAQAYEAKYVDELGALLVDLPDPHVERPGPLGWVGVWEAFRRQLHHEAGVASGRVPAGRGRRFAAAAVVLGPIMIVLAVVALLVVHGLLDGHEVGDGDWHGTGPDLGVRQG